VLYVVNSVLVVKCVVLVNCVVLLLIVLFFLLTVLSYVVFVCKCVLYYCHRVSTQLQFTNISISVETDQFDSFGGSMMSQRFLSYELYNGFRMDYTYVASLTARPRDCHTLSLNADSIATSSGQLYIRNTSCIRFSLLTCSDFTSIAGRDLHIN
jgi:hypothetical protein